MRVAYIILAAIIIVPAILMLFVLRVSLIKTQWEYWRTAYSKKRFDELTSTYNEKKMELKSFKRFARRYTLVAGAIGIVLLWLYSVSAHIGLLLWGLSALIVSLYACASFFMIREKDLQWSDKTKFQLNFARYLVLVSPIIFGFGYILLPRTSQLFDEYAILNMFGLFNLGIGIAAIPFVLWRIGKFLTAKRK